MNNSTELKSDKFESRFVQVDDLHNSTFVFDLPDSWWSRKYEYEWAKTFAQPDDVALDAACGLVHPLKYYLLDNCAETFACDLDSRLTQKEEMMNAAIAAYGDQVANTFPEKYFNKIRYNVCSLSDMPYPDEKFDKLYCISVLEHLSDSYNRFGLLNKARFIFPFFEHQIEDSLREFYRVVKTAGLVILTFDFPRINLNYFQSLIEPIGFEFAGNVDFSRPKRALYSENHKLNCFRAVLRKI